MERWPPAPAIQTADDVLSLAWRARTLPAPQTSDYEEVLTWPEGLGEPWSGPNHGRTRGRQPRDDVIEMKRHRTVDRVVGSHRRSEDGRGIGSLPLACTTST